jgi:alpha-tubulin suppressor-like RCC1 family protein
MKKVAAGYCGSVGLKEDGTVWKWGYGSGTVDAVPLAGVITDIASSGNHTLALDTLGRVWAWGLNNRGQIGTEIGTQPAGGYSTVVQVPLSLAAGVTVTAVAASSNASAALLSNGEIRYWGEYSGVASVRSPTSVTGLGGSAIAIELGMDRIAAVRADGTVWSWLYNLTTPVQVAGMTSAARVQTSFHHNAVFSVTSGGAILANGSNNNGQLGQGNTNVIATTVTIVASGMTRVRLGLFSTAVLALKGDGTVYHWGENSAGQSGDGSYIGSSVPLAVPIPATIKAVSAGWSFALALDTTGQVWGWSENQNGQLDPN